MVRNEHLGQQSVKKNGKPNKKGSRTHAAVSFITRYSADALIQLISHGGQNLAGSPVRESKHDLKESPE